MFSSIWMYSFQINTLIFAFVSIGILIYLKDNFGKIDNVALVACAVCLLAIYLYIPRNFIYDSSVQFFGQNLRIFEIFPFAEDLYRLTVVVATLLILSKVETARRRLG